MQLRIKVFLLQKINFLSIDLFEFICGSGPTVSSVVDVFLKRFLGATITSCHC